MHQFRLRALNLRQELRIETKLQDRSDPRRFRQLRFYDFVGERTKRTRFVDPNKKISSTAPISVLKGRLINYLRTSPNRFLGCGNCFCPIATSGNRNNLSRFGRQLIQVTGLVSLAEFTKQLDPEILEIGLLNFTLGCFHFQR